MPHFQIAIAPVIGAAELSLRRRQSETGAGLANRLLMDIDGHWLLGKQPDGRPIAVGPSLGQAPAVSISHSGNWAAAAVISEGMVGIDIEVPRRPRNVEALAEVFSDVERAVIAVDGEPALLAFWTIREAMAKANGGDIADALKIDCNI